jgi:hypothetical protein
MKLSHKIAVALTVVALGFTPGAWAQGCVLCYTSLANGGPGAMHAFQMAMLTLLCPALLLFLGVVLLIFQRARTATVAPATTRKRVNTVRPVPHSINTAEGRA